MNYAALLKAINTATAQLQSRAAMAVNQALVLRNWLVGAWILEFEQHGKDRAKYGERLLETLAGDLLVKGGRGLNVRILDRSRLLYRTYPILAAAIPATLSPEFLGLGNSGDTVTRIPVTLSPETAAFTRPGANETPPSIRQTPSAELPTPLSPQVLLQLSWSHFQELITINDPWKRAFFENECLQAKIPQCHQD
jgi:hypothetical protein